MYTDRPYDAYESGPEGMWSQLYSTVRDPLHVSAPELGIMYSNKAIKVRVSYTYLA